MFVRWPVGSVLEYFSQVFQQEIRSYLFLGLPSWVLEFVVLLARMDLLFQWWDSSGRSLCGHADSHQDFFLQ
jgi:hypothetical protein